MFTYEQISELFADGENIDLECIEVQDYLPFAVFETYSAFTNTNGGMILLGIEQEQNMFSLKGLADSKKLINDFWSALNKQQIISTNILVYKDIKIVRVNEKELVTIKVPRAARGQKPVYIGNNPFAGTYRRGFEGNYNCTEDEVKRMLKEQQGTLDSCVFPYYGMECVNLQSIRNYRRQFALLKPHHSWNTLDTKNFLKRIGAWGHEVDTEEEGLTLAGLVMFGDVKVITEVLPNFSLLYRESNSAISDQSLKDCITSVDDTWSGSVYDFFVKVLPLLTSDFYTPTPLQGLQQVDETYIHRAIREAFVRTLVHADYYGDGGILIEKKKSEFRFETPGTLHMSVKDVFCGEVCEPRNSNICKMFRAIGLGDCDGEELNNIFHIWKQLQWKHPNLIEEFCPERTILTLSIHPLLTIESVAFIEEVLEDDFALLTMDEVVVLVTAFQEDYVMNERLQLIMDRSFNEVSSLLRTLVEKGHLTIEGQGKGKIFTLSNKFALKGILVY
ncbi:MAG TPA: AAA family ATPase [Bacillus bacterium]|nr:AAA family ATPase [Bacillus sp. (in: firmicutes)]